PRACCGGSPLTPRLPLVPCPAGVGPPVLASGGSLRFAPSTRVSLRSSLAIVFGSFGVLSEQGPRRPCRDDRAGDHDACAAEPFALIAGPLDEGGGGLDRVRQRGGRDHSLGPEPFLCAHRQCLDVERAR